jgi:hypothetical protein
MKHRPFTYNPGSPIAGTSQYGSLAVGTGSQDYSSNPGGVRWWSGPDEELGYVIATSMPSEDVPTPIGDIGSVTFWRSDALTEESFRGLAETVTGQTFVDGDAAKLWLEANGYWSSFFKYIVSAGQTTAGGHQIGDTINKDMQVSTFSYQSSGTPNNTSFNLTASYWDDWGEDIFDNWGYFYLYDPGVGNYLGLEFTNVNQADGIFNEQVFSFNGRTFTIIQGYPVQGIFKFEIRVNDDLPFVFGEAGNMGSDGSTQNFDRSYSYTLDGVNLTLWYNENNQVGNPPEKFFSYYVPFVVDENATKTYTDVLLGSDNLYLYSRQCINGLTVYHSKEFDVKEWVVYDLQFGE